MKDSPAMVWRAMGDEEMLRVGRELATHLQPGDVVLLVGEMGAGKTTLAKGIVAGFGGGAPEDVGSPTFTLVHEYEAERLVYHLDLYRLETEAAVRAIGIDEMLDGLAEGEGALMLVEWGERFPALWPAERMVVTVRDEDGVREVRLQKS